MSEKVYVSRGPGLAWIFFILFLTLKLCGVISWPWLWVFAPLWIPLAIVVVACCLLFIAAFVAHLLD